MDTAVRPQVRCIICKAFLFAESGVLSKSKVDRDSLLKMLNLWSTSTGNPLFYDYVEQFSVHTYIMKSEAVNFVIYI